MLFLEPLCRIFSDSFILVKNVRVFNYTIIFWLRNFAPLAIVMRRSKIDQSARMRWLICLRLAQCQKKLGAPSYPHADIEYSDQTVRMPRLICFCWTHVSKGTFSHTAAHFRMSLTRGVIKNFKYIQTCLGHHCSYLGTGNVPLQSTLFIPTFDTTMKFVIMIIWLAQKLRSNDI